jgi:thioredoxin 1
MCRAFLGLVALAVFAVGCQQPGLQPPKPQPKIKVVAFTATWCGPCQRAKPLLVEIKALGIEVQVVDIDADLALAQQCGVTRVPTFLLLVDGQEAARTYDVLTALSWSRRQRR